MFTDKNLFFWKDLRFKSACNTYGSSVNVWGEERGGEFPMGPGLLIAHSRLEARVYNWTRSRPLSGRRRLNTFWLKIWKSQQESIWQLVFTLLASDFWVFSSKSNNIVGFSLFIFKLGPFGKANHCVLSWNKLPGIKKSIFQTAPVPGLGYKKGKKAKHNLQNFPTPQLTTGQWVTLKKNGRLRVKEDFQRSRPSSLFPK